jgi:hypothetical protein
MMSGVTTISTGSYTFDCIHISSGAVVNIDGAVTIKTKCFTLDAGATITGVGRGYGPMSGPGAGGYDGLGITSLCSGGGHGGNGAPISITTYVGTADLPGGAAYDDPVHPYDMGSGGGWNWFVTTTPDGPPDYPAAGGGLLELIVFDPSSSRLQPATVNGTIDMSGSSYFGSGHLIFQTTGFGAGGAIWLEASQIYGTGALLAEGGSGYGGGGGGIISVINYGSPFLGTISAAGGGGAQNGVVTMTVAPLSGY